MTLTLVTLDPVQDPLYAGELDLRYRVLREPLGMTRQQVTFEGETTALHLVALQAGAVVGCVLFHSPSGRLRAMAVDPALQGSGVGRRLVLELETRVRERGVTAIRLHARDTATGFYEKLGYALGGEPFLESGLPHRTMTKEW